MNEELTEGLRQGLQGYVQDNEHLLERINEVVKLLSGLIKSIGDKR